MDKEQRFSLRTIVVLILGVALMVLSLSSYLDETKKNDSIIAPMLLVVLLVGIFWFVGGLVNRKSILKQNKWRRGLGLVVTSSLIFILLFVGYESAMDEAGAKALFKLAIYLMISGAGITYQLLSHYAERHS